MHRSRRESLEIPRNGPFGAVATYGKAGALPRQMLPPQRPPGRPGGPRIRRRSLSPRRSRVGGTRAKLDPLREFWLLPRLEGREGLVP